MWTHACNALIPCTWRHGAPERGKGCALEVTSICELVLG